MAELKKILLSRNNRLMLVILIIGIAIIMIAGDVGERAKETDENSAAFASEQETRLSGILSRISGAGEVSVMISYESTMVKDIAYDDSGERVATTGGDAIVLKENYPAVKGVVVIADGAADARVRRDLKEAVMALCGTAANRVCVYKSGASR